MSQAFLSRVASPEGFEVLFDYVPDVYFFVKDADGRFMRVNRAFVKLVRAGVEADVIGRRDSDFFTRDLADSYQRSDREVLTRHRPLIDAAELVRKPDGSVDWFVTTKLPLLDKSGATIGVAGYTRDVKKMMANNAQVLSWAPVLEVMVNSYARPPGTAALAEMMALSASQFNRQFRRRFHTTPRAYMTDLRMKAACRLLTETSLSLSEVALKVGFYDQSHFTNQFANSFGISPAKYRTLHQQPTS
jgi:PAS domain S-box-containing protein